MGPARPGSRPKSLRISRFDLKPPLRWCRCQSVGGGRSRPYDLGDCPRSDADGEDDLVATRKNRMAGVPSASRRRAPSRSPLAALLAVLLAGCAVNREPSTFEELGQDANTLGFGRLYPQDPNETDLQLGVGDTLLVTVEDAENLTGPRVIRQDGKITLPVIGDVMAAGLTSTDIQKLLLSSGSASMATPCSRSWPIRSGSSGA